MKFNGKVILYWIPTTLITLETLGFVDLTHGRTDVTFGLRSAATGQNPRHPRTASHLI
jgi:hypothetical protein